MMTKSKYCLAALLVLLQATGCTKDTSTTDDEDDGNWIKRSTFEGVARSEAVAFVINDLAYVGTGYDGEERLQDFWSYNAALNSWEQKATFPGVARSSAAGFSTGTNGYIATGYDGTNKLKDCWQYNATSNEWVQKADFGGSARYDAVAAGISGQGFISSGWDGNYRKDLWQYDPSADTWTQKVSLSGDKRQAAVCFVHDNKLYVGLGQDNGTTVNDLHEYDPATETWTEKRKLTSISDESYDDDYSDIVRYNAVAFVIGDKAYVTTGTNGSLTNKTWEYDFSTDTWSRKTAFERSSRTGAVAFTIQDRGFVTTGNSGSSYYDDLNEFNPAQTYEEND
ncbi:Kelch repeat-containing protein [Panacibacter microcysteis]|nr:kelch-like protein [Panacibacter microcysteis]